jgi:hypothetical protein
MGRVVTFLLGLVAAAVFISSAAVHLRALVPGTHIAFERVVWLHVVTLGLCVLAAGHYAVVANRAKRLGWTEKDYQREIGGRAPCGVWAVGLALLLYAIVNFVHYMATSEGNAEVRDGTYVLIQPNSTRVIREITEEEYHEQRRLDAQGISGHWLFFSGVAAAYFLVLVPRTREFLETPAPAP